jgi:hypothetical protein
MREILHSTLACAVLATLTLALTLPLVSCGAAGPTLGWVPEQRPYSVCEALNGADTAGRAIAVRGLFGSGFGHALQLSQDTGNDPCRGWRARFLTAPSAIALTWDEADTAAVVPCLERYRSEGRRVPAEFGGTLLRKSRLPLIFRRADGTYYGLNDTGYGNTGVYAAMLKIRTARCAGE